MEKNSGGSTAYLVMATIVAALGGLLFGYDTAVISGAEKYLQEHFHLGSGGIGWAASCALVGCIIGAACGGTLADVLGRKKGLLVCAVVYMVSGVATALPQTLDQLVLGRLLAGLGIGAASMISPMYIAEIAPARVRGRLVSLYQLAIVIGIFLVFFVNMLIQHQGTKAWNADLGWRWMFAASTPPAILFALAIIFVPESPRWLMKKNRRNEALAVLGRVGGEQYAQEETGQIEVSLAQTQGSFTELFTVYRPPLIMGCLLAVFSQLSGINTVMYFGPRIFEEIGTATATAFLWEVSVGVVNIVFTLVSFWLIDRAGRKVLLAGGTAVQFLALALVGWLWLPLDAARLEHYVPQAVSTLGLVPQGLPDPLFPQAYVALEVGAAKSFSPGWTGSLVVAGILVYVASFAVGNGVVCWVLISEIFPNKIRGRAMSLATLALWAACFLVSLTFVPLMDYVGKTPTFWAYGTVSLISSLYVMLAVPETRRRSLEDIEASWTR